MTKIQIHILDTYLKENTNKGGFSFLRLEFTLHVKLELTNYGAIKVLFVEEFASSSSFCCLHECDKMKHCFECLFIMKVKEHWSTKFVACCTTYESYKTMRKLSFFLLVYVFFIVNLLLSMFFIENLLNWTWVYILFKTLNNLGSCVFFVFAFLLMF